MLLSLNSICTAVFRLVNVNATSVHEYICYILHGRRSAGFGKTDTKPSDGRQLSDSGAARARTVVAAD